MCAQKEHKTRRARQILVDEVIALLQITQSTLTMTRATYERSNKRLIVPPVSLADELPRLRRERFIPLHNSQPLFFVYMLCSGELHIYQLICAHYDAEYPLCKQEMCATGVECNVESTAIGLSC